MAERVGIYVCHCGSNIAGKVDVEEVAKWAGENIDDMVVSKDYKFMCSSLGQSLVEEDKLDLARVILQRAGDRLVLPSDHVVAAAFDALVRMGRRGLPSLKSAILAEAIPQQVEGRGRVIADRDEFWRRVGFDFVNALGLLLQHFLDEPALDVFQHAAGAQVRERRARGGHGGEFGEIEGLGSAETPVGRSGRRVAPSRSSWSCPNEGADR